MDDEFLLRFLRARRFDYDSAFHLIFDYYHLFQRNRQLFMSMDQLRVVFEYNTMMVIDGRSKNDEAVFLLRLGQWNPRKFTFDHILSAAIMIMEYIIRDPRIQINGIVCVVDMLGFGWNQLRNFGPNQAKKVINILSYCLPIRIKTIFIVNESTLTDIGFAIMRPFTSEELHEKIVFLGTNYGPVLHQSISSDHLPIEFGGKNGRMNSMEWFKRLQSFEIEMKKNFLDYGLIKNDLINEIYNGSKCSGAKKCLGSSSNSEATYPSAVFRKSPTCNGYLFDYYNSSTSID